MLLVNVYLDTNDTDHVTNSRILLEVAELIATLGLPFIVAGDWQMSPEHSTVTSWAEAVDAVIVSTGGVTCANSVSGDKH